MKIAIIFTGNINHQSGHFNHVFNRIKLMKNVSKNDIDVYFIQRKYSRLFSFFKKVNVKPNPYSEKDGIKFINIWIHQTLLGYICTYKLKLNEIIGSKQLMKSLDLFNRYDIVSSNDIESSFLANEIKKTYNIPYVITWHGSDINVYPYLSKGRKDLVISLIKNSSCNLFVSKKLLMSSNDLISEGTKTYYYTGPSSLFYKKTDEERLTLKNKFNIKQQVVLGFVGNLVDIKNVLLLPEIFKKIQEKRDSICFVIVGSGPLLDKLKNRFEALTIKNAIFLGKVFPELIPDIMNVINILLLPSKNEGLPLVCMEALKCGSFVVGSKAGGIPEIIGNENSFELNDTFVDNIVERCIEIIDGEVPFKELSSEFNIISAIGKEIAIYDNIVSY